MKNVHRERAGLSKLQQLVKDTMQPLQKPVAFTPKERTVLYRTVKLNEEVGELCNDILAVLSLQRKSKLKMFDKRNLYEEFADVLLTTIQLASEMNVNLDRAVNDKLKKIQERETAGEKTDSKEHVERGNR